MRQVQWVLTGWYSRGTPGRCRIGFVSVLTRHHHAVGGRHQAGPAIGAAVDGDQAVEADAHPAEVPAGCGITRGRPKGGVLGCPQRCGDALPGSSKHRLPLEFEVDVSGSDRAGCHHTLLTADTAGNSPFSWVTSTNFVEAGTSSVCRSPAAKNPVRWCGSRVHRMSRVTSPQTSVRRSLVPGAGRSGGGGRRISLLDRFAER